jgi:hypothetical protein
MPSTEEINSLAYELIATLGLHEACSNPAHDFRMGHSHSLPISSFPKVRPIAQVNHCRNPGTAYSNNDNIAARPRHHLGSDDQSRADASQHNRDHPVGLGFTVRKRGYQLCNATGCIDAQDDVTTPAVCHPCNVAGHFLIRSDGLSLEFEERAFGYLVSDKSIDVGTIYLIERFGEHV